MILVGHLTIVTVLLCVYYELRHVVHPFRAKWRERRRRKSRGMTDEDDNEDEASEDESDEGDEEAGDEAL